MNPFTDLIAFRNQYGSTKEGELSLEQTILSGIQVPEKQACQKFLDTCSKLPNLTSMIEKYPIKITISQQDIDRLIVSCYGTTKSDMFAIIVCFYTIQWFQNEEKNKDTQSTKLICLFNQTKRSNYQRMINLFFDALVGEIIIAYKKKIPESIVNLLFTHITQNKTLEPSFFQRLISLFRAVTSSNNVKSIDEMNTVIETLLDKQYKLIKGVDLSPLVIILQPFIAQLDTSCFASVCRMSMMLQSKILTDSFVLVPSVLFAFIAQNSTINCEVTDIEKEEGFPEVSSVSVFHFTDQICQQFQNGIARPPYEILQSSNYQPARIVNEMTIKIAEALSLAAQPMKMIFFQTMMNLIETMKAPGTHCLLYNTLNTLLDKVGNPIILQDIAPALFRDLIFAPSLNVFKGTLTDTINTLRKQTFTIIQKIAPEICIESLLATHNHPFLFTENLIRMLDLGFDLRLFSTERVLKLIFRTALQLQQKNLEDKSDCVYQARSAHFTFTTRLVLDERTLPACISQNIFVYNFSLYMFEPGLTQFVIRAFRDALSRVKIESASSLVCLDEVSLVFSDIINACITNKEDDRYLDLLLLLAQCLREGPYHNPIIATKFRRCLSLLVTFITQRKNSELLTHTLYFAHVCCLNPGFTINNKTMAKIIKAIKVVDGDDPSPETEKILKMILCGGAISPGSSSAFITQPSALTMVLGAFGMSKRLPDFLQWLLDLCSFSHSNATALHNGDVDKVLLQAIRAGSDECTVRPTIFEIKMKLSEEVKKSIVLPLLQKIFEIHSDNVIASSISQYVAENGSKEAFNFLQWLSIPLDHNSKAPIPQFPVGVGRQFSCKLPSIAQGFSISFYVRADTSRMLFEKGYVNICNIDLPSNTGTIELYFSQTSIGAAYSDAKRIRVPVVKQIKQQEWTRYTFVFDMAAKPVIIQSYSEDSKLVSSNLKAINIPHGETIFSFCEDEVSWSNAVIADIRIYGRMLSEEEVVSLAINDTNPEDPIFDSSVIKNPGKKLNAQNYKVESAPAVPRTLIDSMARGENCNIIAEYFNNPQGSREHPQLVFGLLGTIFRRSIVAQKQFKMVKIIAGSLYRHPERVTSQNYFAAWDVFAQITDDVLQQEWFKHLIVNLWLYSQATPYELKIILVHWSHTVINAATHMIGKAISFSRLLNQYKCFFGEDSTSFGEQYSKEDIEESRKLFAKFIERAAYISLSKEDIKNLFTHMSTATEKKYRLDLLEIALNIASPIVHTKGFDSSLVAGLHYFLSNDEDIDLIESTLLVIHETAGDDLYRAITGAAYQIRKSKRQAEIFDRLLQRIESYPNLYPLMCALMLSTGQGYSQKLAAVMHKWSDERKVLFTPPNWFIWPVIAAMQKADLFQLTGVRFVAETLMSSPRRDTELFQILYFIRFVEYCTDVGNDFAITFLTAVIQATDPSDEKFVSKVFYSCFATAFFHFKWTQHSPNMISEAEKSPFGFIGILNPTRTVFQPELNDVTHLEHVMYFDPMTIPVFCRARIDERGWIDQPLGVVALGLLSRTKITSLEEMKLHFMNLISPKDFTPEKRNELEKASLEFFNMQRHQFENKFKSLFAAFAKSLRSVMEFAKQSIAEAPAFAGTPNKTASKKAMEAERERWKAIVSGPDKNDELVRDKTICIHYCALKMKKRNNERTKHTLRKADIPAENLFEQSCILVSLKGNRDISIKIQKDNVFLIGSDFVKGFSIQMIRLVLMRKRMGYENSIEFFLSDGRTYLIDLTPTDNTTVIKILQKLMVYENQFIQKMKSHEMFEMFPLTFDWTHGVLSNFEYLMKINAISGRSFNDPTLYPVFPSILKSFKENTAREITKTPFTVPSLGRVQKLNQREPKSLEETVCKNGCIAPEFFFLPAVVHKEDQLPEFASSPFDFIYKHRRLLESDEVSKMLPSFIDSVWGVKQNSLPHHQLFFKPHPPKTHFDAGAAEKETYAISPPAPIVYATALRAKSPLSHNVLFVSNDGTVFSILLSISKKLAVKDKHELGKLCVQPDTKFSASQRGICALTTSQHSIVIFRDGRPEVTHNIFTQCKLVAYCDLSFLYCPDKCTVAYAADKAKILKPLILCHTRACISTMAAHPSFKMFALALEDGTVEVRSLKDGRLVGSSSIGSQPTHIQVMPNSGIVVTASDEWLASLTVDGALISKSRLGTPIKRMYQVADISDFDYVAFEDGDGHVGYFEAANPDKRTLVTSASEATVFIGYNALKMAFIIVERSGLIRVVPHSQL